MTQTLMANFEDEEGVFPMTETVLFLGGPKHAQECEVIAGDQTWQIFDKAPPTQVDGVTMLGSGAFLTHRYIRKPIQAEDESGTYFRDVFVHESVPNAQVAQQLLMAALLARFIKGGHKVLEADVSD